MKINLPLLVFTLLFLNGVSGQRSPFQLIFSAIDSSAYVQVDSIRIINRTQGADTILYWPDTTLLLDYQVGMSQLYFEDERFKVLQNFPNPAGKYTTVLIQVPVREMVSIAVTDNLGRLLVHEKRELAKGQHAYRVYPGSSGLLFFSAQWKGQNSYIKILNPSSFRNTCTMEYLGIQSDQPEIKLKENLRQFLFNPGDTLLCVGYTDTLESGILDNPEANMAYIFQFATNIPCPGIPNVNYEGQIYNTIQIFSQCWLKENLNIGTMIPGSEEMSDNGLIEKYCYDNEPDSCEKYGGLYQWDEMMQYNTQQGTQGICPPGWHIPSDEEWKVLEGAADSHYNIGDPVWDSHSERGFDAGTNLKTTSGWYYYPGWYNYGNGIDMFDFSGKPGGIRFSNGDFYIVGKYGNWWSSSEQTSVRAFAHNLGFDYPGAVRFADHNYEGFSVRCLRD